MTTPAAPQPDPKAQTGNYLVILEAEDTFKWWFEDNTDTVFDLRIVPDEQHQVFRRQNTKRKTLNGGAFQEITDWDAVSHLSLSYAVRNITGLKRKTPDGIVPLEFTAASHETRDRILHNLPEKVKVEILRLCVSKEAGLERAEGKKS